jgi:plastocyanin
VRVTTASAVVLLLFAGNATMNRTNAVAQVNGKDNTVAMVDNCLPGDPGYDSTGGCQLKAHQGDVSSEEFGALLFSPLSSALIGHPSWRNEPSHLTANLGRRIHIRNEGGRAHTFTEVADFGGGSVSDFNVGMTRAPECPADPSLVTDVVFPGDTVKLDGLGSGLHKFQCCFHPWMRGTVRVQ